MRPEIVYGEAKHYVTLTFYIGQNDSARLLEILDVLQEGNVSSAVFFMQPSLMESNATLANTVRQNGYTVLPWRNTNQYEPGYTPTEFEDILLSDRDVLGRTVKIADVMAFYRLALHSSNSSIVAFTPSAARFNASTSIAVLEELLENNGRTLVFTNDGRSSTSSQPVPMVVGQAENLTTTSIGANTTSRTVVTDGEWSIQDLRQRYPRDISIIQTDSGPSYLIDTTLVIGENAHLDISGQNVLIASPVNDKDRRLEIQGSASIINSHISSWNTIRDTQDLNPYHQRPFILVNGGQVEIRNSTISHLGFPLAGLSEERAARAGIMFLETGNFTIANSTIAFNFDGIYARNSSDFQIIGNEIYGNTRSGIDIRAGSNNYVIRNNNVHDNGYEGMACSECTNGGIIENNKVEHNEETGIKLFSHTNSTTVSRNDLRHNERFGIYLRSNSTGNTVSSNTVVGSQEGIAITGSSVRNTIADNILSANDVAIELDDTSQSNVFRNNRMTNTTLPG
jgi:parallel beta-helix repeat protein